MYSIDKILFLEWTNVVNRERNFDLSFLFVMHDSE